MIKRTLALLVLATAPLLAADLKPMNLAEPRFKGDGGSSKVFGMKLFDGKSPEFIFKRLGRRLNPHEKDSAGLPRWTSRRCKNTGEYLATYKIVVVDERATIEGRHVWSFKADFYKETLNGQWKCWSACYKLLPKGVDWHKEDEKYRKNEKE